MAARATTATVLIRMGGTYWVNYDATNVGNLCTAASYILDSFTHPDTLGTGNNEKELETSIVMQLIARNDWGSQGGFATGQPMPPELTREIKDMAERLATVSANVGFSAEPMVDEG